MARTSQIAKTKRKLKYKIRQRNRCRICGRPGRFIDPFPRIPPRRLTIA